jgi:predicted AAA+ superfamily ATPase
MLDRLLGRLLRTEHFAVPAPKMAFLVGPRQCGKTTLARALQAERKTPELYLNWDDLAWRRESAQTPYGFIDAFRPATAARPLAVLDEIHKFPRWKTYLKGLWDTRGARADILVTGSGRLDVFRRGGDSLMGRYHQYRLHPFSVSEILKTPFDPDRDTPELILRGLFERPSAPGPAAREALGTLLRFGGFPEPFLAQSERRHRLWLRERRERLVREDLRDLTRIQLLSSVEQMVELLIPRVGSLLSLNNLRGELGASMQAVRGWMEQLERLYFCYRLRPYAGRLARALSREPKLFLYDWSELRDEGARLENLIASALLRWCHFTEDWGQERLELRFVRDKEKREADFLLLKDGAPFLLLEVKVSETRPPASLEHFASRLGNVRRALIVGNLSHPGTAAGTLVLPAALLLERIP